MGVPGHNDDWAATKLKEFKEKHSERKRFLACFIGAHKHSFYEEIPGHEPNNVTAQTVRDALFDYVNFENVSTNDISVGEHLRPTTKYYERMVDCEFCFIPKGVGFTNGRLMETFSSGCIPIILSDKMEVPFQSFLNWKGFSIKWPMVRNINEVEGLDGSILVSRDFDLIFFFSKFFLKFFQVSSQFR